MTIIVEDGTCVANANSYVTADDLRAYADLRGLAGSITSDDSTLEPYLVLACDKIESYRSRFQGIKTDADNALQFPRSGVFIDGIEIDDDVIPTELKNAQCQFALDAMATTLQPNVLPSDGGATIEKTVGQITVKYATPDKRTQPKFSKAEAWLAPLLKGLMAVAVRT